jgi:hypothetical protein
MLSLLLYGYIPMAWGQVRVAVIQQKKKSAYTKANTYLFISLPS